MYERVGQSSNKKGIESKGNHRIILVVCTILAGARELSWEISLSSVVLNSPNAFP